MPKLIANRLFLGRDESIQIITWSWTDAKMLNFQHFPMSSEIFKVLKHIWKMSKRSQNKWYKIANLITGRKRSWPNTFINLYIINNFKTINLFIRIFMPAKNSRDRKWKSFAQLPIKKSSKSTKPGFTALKFALMRVKNLKIVKIITYYSKLRFLS